MTQLHWIPSSPAEWIVGLVWLVYWFALNHTAATLGRDLVALGVADKVEHR